MNAVWADAEGIAEVRSKEVSECVAHAEEVQFCRRTAEKHEKSRRLY